MPSIDELKTLVKEFRSQGVSEEEIKKALLDMNVESSMVEQLLGGEEEKEKDVEIPSPEEVPKPSVPEEPPEVPEVVETSTIPTEVKLNEIKQSVSKIEAHAEKLSDVEEMRAKLSSMADDITEIKAQLRAIQKLLREILNTERSILLDLYEKTKGR